MSQLPSKIGKYKILAQIGKGGMGAVFKAEHPTLNRIVIIKQLTSADSQDVIERFRREAKIMMDFRNEHIVQVYDHFKENDVYFIVMEYVDGITLEDLIRERRFLSNQAAALIFNEICKALKYAHDQLVIHRDIKPANILLSREGVVKLVDFGVSTSLDGRNSEDGLTRPGMTIGTPSYLAPEQIANAKNRDKRTDIYSMGVMLYEMMVGRKPFQGGFTPEIIAAIEKGKYTPPRKINPKISPRLQRIVKKAMHHKIKRRFQDLGQVQAKLSGMLKSYPTQETINRAIKEYLEGSSELDRKPGRLNIKPSISGHAAALGFALTLFLITLSVAGIWSWQQGYHYEYLYPDQYGALQIEINIRKRNKLPDQMFLKTMLFSQKQGRLELLDDVRFTYRKGLGDPTGYYDTLSSPRIYLEKGNYMILFYIENEQYRQNVFIAPRSIQRNLHDPQEAHRISFTVDTPPKLPVKMIYRLTDSHSGKALSQQTDAISVFAENRWQKWEDFIQVNSRTERFTSGSRFRFKFEQEGYYTQYHNVTIQPEQTILKLDINMVPLPGELYLKTTGKNLSILLNNNHAYIKGEREPEFAQLPELSTEYKRLVLYPGDYFLTAKNQRLIFNATSTTQKLTVQSGKKVFADLSIDPDNQSVNILFK